MTAALHASVAKACCTPDCSALHAIYRFLAKSLCAPYTHVCKRTGAFAERMPPSAHCAHHNNIFAKKTDTFQRVGRHALTCKQVVRPDPVRKADCAEPLPAIYTYYRDFLCLCKRA